MPPNGSAPDPARGSEPPNDLPGGFIEVPKSTVAVLGKSGYHHPFLADEQ